jgi:membrane protein required for colicin V production
MNWIDVVVIALLIAAAIWGIFKGFLAQLISIIGVVIGIWGASKLTPSVSAWAISLFGAEDSASAIKMGCFILLVVLIIIICHLLGKLMEKVMNLTILGGLNKFLGAVFCDLKVALILVAVAALVKNGLEAANVESPEVLGSSKAYAYLNSAAEHILPFIKQMFAKMV